MGKKYEINEDVSFTHEKSIDGELQECKFTQPYGMVLSNDQEYIFVADTDQNALRILDLQNQVCQTIVQGKKNFLKAGSLSLASIPQPKGICVD